MKKSYSQNYHLWCDELGNVYRTISGINPIATRIQEGRYVITYRDKVLEKMRCANVARIMADAWNLPRKNDNDVVIHKDGNYLNNAIYNLYYGSRSDSKLKAYREIGNTYKRKTGCSVYASKKPIDSKTKDYVYFFSSEKDCSDKGFNVPRIFAAYKHQKRYKGLYWKLLSYDFLDF